MITPKSQIRSALRQLFLRSKERAAAIQRDKYTCQICGVKQSKKKGTEVKVQVHHLKGVGNWDKVIDLIYLELLCSPEFLQTLCVDCHKKESYDKP